MSLLDADRYARQLRLPEVGEAGQARLARARILLVGAGGLGTPVALYLAAAGVGHLTIADGDVVDASNLHRQPLFSEADVGRPKAAAAAARLHALNRSIRIEVAPRVTPENVSSLVTRADVVVDASDNFPTRYLLSDACVLAGVPLVHGSVSRFDGQVTLLVGDGAPCYRCLFPDPPRPGTVPSCAEAGVLGVLPGMVGMTQAAEVLNRLLGIGESLAGRLLLLDGRVLRWTEVAVRRDPACAACGEAARLRAVGDLGDYDDPACEVAADAMTSPSDDPRMTPASPASPAAPEALPLEVDPAEAHRRIVGGWSPVLLDVREPWEWRVARLEGATLLPMGRVAAEWEDLAADQDYLVYCHHGVRSASVAEWLRARGLTRVVNLAGGIDRWSQDVDASIPRY